MHGAVGLGLQPLRSLGEFREKKRVRRGEAPEKLVAGDGAARRATRHRVRRVHVPDNLRQQSRKR